MCECKKTELVRQIHFLGIVCGPREVSLAELEGIWQA